MDSISIDCNEPSVDEGAFWHTNMDLYYGYLPGEIVEVEHESSKYWLAKIQYCYKHLILLKWVGNYGEFWVDTSMTNVASNSSSTLAEFNTPKRLFPLGYHLQSQLKSQFALEKPTKVLVAPSLYNPACDPYANIRTVDDLLAHEEDDQISKDDAFVNKSNSENLELALVCKKKIQYKQEDVDELEAAIQNLSEIDNDETAGHIVSLGNAISIYTSNTADESGDTTNTIEDNGDQNKLGSVNKDSGIDSDPSSEQPSTSPDRKASEDVGKCSKPAATKASTDDIISDKVQSVEHDDQIERDNIALELCKQLQTSAINSGRYMGLNKSNTKQTDEVFFLKPKQFFDMGGANHEKLFVPGTLVEVCHIQENPEGFQEIFFWFAYVLKNTGGRLTLRWFLCDEPKFKQGRLELKSSRSAMVKEELDETAQIVEQSADDEKTLDLPGAVSESKAEGIPANSITFCLHFCHPRVHTLHYAEKNQKHYQLPKNIIDYITKILDGDRVLEQTKKEHLDHIFDARRMNLDKDRPLIDHLLAAVRHRSPNYLDLIFSSKDKEARREVLISCPKLTKLLKATVIRELDSGVFEIHSDPMQEDNEIIKFIYPYDSSHAVLPLDWAINNEDCLSVNPSRNPTPDQSDKQVDFNKTNDNKRDPVDGHRDQNSLFDVQSECEPMQQEMMVDRGNVCLKTIRNTFPKAGGPFRRVSKATLSAVDLENCAAFNEYDPALWSKALRYKELNASTFHCCIDYSQKEAVESKFKVMDQLEVTHPSSDSTICLGRIRKVVFPLLWVQLSTQCFTLIPYVSTDIYPAGWCSTYNQKLVSMLPPRKRCLDISSQNGSKKRKKNKASEENGSREAVDKTDSSGKRANSGPLDHNQLYENEQFNLDDIHYRQLDFDFILQEKNNYIKIYFNHKCFTGPSLSKSKICSLPQYVGPGPMHLVLEEVVTKIISVAYVPPRILNDLSSKSFEELLVERQLTNTKNQTFKAKYQKRVHRERVPVCLNPKDIAAYCECICEHIKCCYNLFGPQLYDGDDCPSHCRSLTKSNKFMKRATYYREKARQGEFLASEITNSTSAKKANSTTASNGSGSKTSRARYAGRGSSESTNSSILSRSEQVQSRASSSSSGDGDGATNDLKESLKAVIEETKQEVKSMVEQASLSNDTGRDISNRHQDSTTLNLAATVKLEPSDTHGSTVFEYIPESDCQNQPEFNVFDSHQKIANPEDWTVEDVAQYLDCCQLGMFKSNIESEGIDGQALMLLDHAAIREHFQDKKRAKFSPEEVGKLCRFIESIRTRAEARHHSIE